MTKILTTKNLELTRFLAIMLFVKFVNATISHHLSQLKKAGLVYETKEKNFVFYELNTTVLDDILFWLGQFQLEPKPRKEIIKNEN
jgi:predicted transcriptional regulator